MKKRDFFLPLCCLGICSILSIFTTHSLIQEKQLQKKVQTSQNLIERKGVFVFFGDTHRGRGFTYYEKRKKNYKENTLGELFDKKGKYQRFIQGSDEVIANLEVAVSPENTCQKRQKPIIISMLPENISVLKEIGISVVNTANNHSYDCGENAYKKAQQYFKKQAIKQFGDGRKEESRVLTGTYDGEKFAFFGFEEIEINPNWEEKIQKVQKYSEQGYITIVSLHWGIEYSQKHTPTQETLAHRFVDEAGAKLIIGHHPHVTADKEIYKGIPIYYSLGNFIFDQPFESTLKGLGIKCTISRKNSSCEELEFKRDENTYAIHVN